MGKKVQMILFLLLLFFCLKGIKSYLNCFISNSCNIKDYKNSFRDYKINMAKFILIYFVINNKLFIEYEKKFKRKHM